MNSDKNANVEKLDGSSNSILNCCVVTFFDLLLETWNVYL